MRFEITLRNSIHQPWRDNYIDYAKLKKSLKEDDTLDSSGSKESQIWTEADEGAFVDELVNVQLEKVNAFQAATSNSLRERTAQCEIELEEWVPQEFDEADNVFDQGGDKKNVARRILQELDRISDDINELEKFSRINFTGFLKAAKKHDRKRGTNYKIRPLLQVRLAALPFNSEDYSPLLYRFVFILEGLLRMASQANSVKVCPYCMLSYAKSRMVLPIVNLLSLKPKAGEMPTYHISVIVFYP